jgi:hypothetical protein
MNRALLVDPSSVALGSGGAFYRCEDSRQCGMRFPVTVGDPFRGCCPRCGAPVRLVAQVELAENGASNVGASPEVAVPGMGR